MGERNTHLFLIFLLTNIAFLTLGAWFCWMAMPGWRAWRHGPAGALFLLCFLCDLLILGFLVHHLYLIYAGMTTNESAKWSDVADAIRNGEVFIFHLDEGPKVIGINPDGTSSEPIPRALRHRVESLSEITNIYDHGAWQNFKDIFSTAKSSQTIE